MNREIHVRICGRLGAKFPGPTRQLLVEFADAIFPIRTTTAARNNLLTNFKRIVSNPQCWSLPCFEMLGEGMLAMAVVKRGG